MVRSPRRRSAVVASGLVLAATLVTTVSSPPSAAAYSCSFPSGPNTYTWDGGGGADRRWTTEANWQTSAGVDPVIRPNDNVNGNTDIRETTDTDNTFVCIPDGFEVEVDVHVAVEAMDLGDSTVVVGVADALFLMDDVTPSVARAGSTVSVVGGTLGGTGTLQLSGDLALGTAAPTPAALSTYPAANQTGMPPAPGGSLEVLPTGEVAVQGPTNVDWGYRLEVQGVVTTTGPGYLAADRGTSFELRPHAAGVGTLSLENDGHYHEGDASGLPENALSDFTNEGLVRKTAGSLSGIYADYQRVGVGRVEVSSGTLLIPGSEESVHVAAGSGYGTGTCAVWDVGCEPTVRPVDRQSALFELPADPTAADPIPVQVTEEAPSDLPTDPFGDPVEVSAPALDVTRAAPATIELAYDADSLDGETPDTLTVARQPHDGAWGSLRDCVGGAVPAGAIACVDRDASHTIDDPTNTDADGDVVMVVRTTGTSRWIGRKIGPADLQPTSVMALWDPARRAYRLQWVAPRVTDGLVGYQVEDRGEVVAQAGPTTQLSVPAGDLAPGPHSFVISPSYENRVGESSDPRSAPSYRTVPGPASGVRLTRIPGRRVGLVTRWRPPSSGAAFVSRFVVQLRQGRRVVRTRAVSRGARSSTFAGLRPGVVYRVVVRAENAYRVARPVARTARAR